MLLSPLTDVKNFAVGAVSGGLRRGGRWGSWAFGYRGESYAPDGKSGQMRFERMHIGGLLLPAVLVGLFGAVTFGMGAPAVALGLYAGGVLGAIGLGMVTGMVSGGFAELSEGRAARREWQAELSQQRDMGKLEKLQAQLEKAHGKAGQIHEKIESLKEKMHERAGKHSFVGAEMARRSGGGASKGRG